MFYFNFSHQLKTSFKGSNRPTCRNGAYHWVLEDGVPTDGKILTYGLAFALLAYSKVRRMVFQSN